MREQAAAPVRRRHHALGREQGQEGEQGDHRQVLQQQHPERRLADRALAQAFLLQHLQHYGGGRHGHDETDRDGALHGQSDQQGRSADRHGRRRHLRPAQAEDRAAQAPQERGPHLQPDQEQQDHHAEFGELHHIGLLADQAEREGADHRAGDQVAQHRAHAEPLGQGHGDHAGGQIDQGLDQEVLASHG